MGRVADLSRHSTHHVASSTELPGELDGQLAQGGFDRPRPRAHRIGVVEGVDHGDVAQNREQLDEHAARNDAQRPLPAGGADRRRAGCRRSTARLDETLQRQVAIKLMNREIASDSDQLERFRREARAVAQLSHPHIVGVIDCRRGRPAGPTSCSSTSRARRSRSGSAASAACRSPRRSPMRSRSRARSAPPTPATSSTATSSPRTC